MKKYHSIYKFFFYSACLFLSWQPLQAIETNPYDSLKTQSPEIKKVIQSLSNLPETRRIVGEATLAGPITIVIDYSKSMPFEALWDCGERRIVIDGTVVKSFGKMLCDVLFELHNAASTPKNDDLWNRGQKGLVDCDTYVKAAEKIEHDNVLSTVAILKAGIDKGIFPKSSWWEVVEDFEIHYKIQQLSDHSLLIAQEYQAIKPPNIRSLPYTGTVNNLRFMSKRQKLAMAGALYSNYLRSKHMRMMRNPQRTEPFVETPWEGKRSDPVNLSRVSHKPNVKLERPLFPSR